jgi:aspartate carbamoyltransferase catalytic subunit
LSKRDLITIADLSNAEIEEIFSLADQLVEKRYGAESELRNKIMATLFYEASTRTRLSFESAMQRLGGSVISCADMRSSSTAKGESLADTARVLSSYADILVVRHPWDGAAQAMAEHADVPLINAGDGSHEHPTQTLCDLYTLRKEKGRLRGLTVALCGDLKHGRTVHSLVYALARFGVHVITLAAKGMELPQYVLEQLESSYGYGMARLPEDSLAEAVQATDAVYLTPNLPHQLALFTHVDPEVERRLKELAAGVKLDAFYMTRKQKERLASPGAEGEYPRLGRRFLRERRFRDTLVMHPLPRVDELSAEIDQDRRGVYFKQAAYGVPVRMALLLYLLARAPARRRAPAQDLYRVPPGLPSPCANAQCVTRNERGSTAPRFHLAFDGPSAALILRCHYCDHRSRAQLAGHVKTRRYCLYDRELASILKEWLRHGELIVFESIKQAEELGYEPYRSGPQRTIMDEEEVRSCIRALVDAILADAPVADEPERLLLLGIRTKGAVLARRIAREIESRREGRVALGEIEIFGAEEGIWPGPGNAAADGPEVQDRHIVIVDDVIQTGRTVRSALTIVFKRGRPRSVKLAVLIDRGHREMPLKPNYVGKHIPSSERERVRVKLREVEQDERDKVVVYSIVQPAEAAARSSSV